VVVEEIDVESVAVLEAENDSPVPADRHGPEAPQLAFEWVQAKTRNVEGLSRSGGVQRRENTLDLTAQRRVDPARIAIFVEPFEAAMPKVPDHEPIV
jgi:hypothetical protein